MNRNIMIKDTTKAAKLEKKLNVILAGYLVVIMYYYYNNCSVY